MCRSFWLCALLLSLLALSGCAPDPVYRLRAGLTEQDASEEWVQGRQYVTRSSAGVDVSLAYERTARGRHVLLAEVVNRSDTPFTVDPVQFRCLLGQAVAESAVRTFADAVARDTLPALDPEQKILTLDLQREREEAQEQTAAAFALVEVVADAAGDVAEIASGNRRTPEEQAADAIEDAGRQARLRARRADYKRALRSLEGQRALWAETALRRTTLPPGTEARGRVFFPVREETGYLTIEVAAGPSQTRFFFWQYQYEP